MMSSGDLYLRVIRVIATTQRIAQEALALDTTFEELGFDSLDSINILFALEEEFNISIPDEAGKRYTVRQVVEGIAVLLAAKNETSNAGPRLNS
jgi:acyl carrier protein